MTSIIDERGYNQEFVPTKALTERNRRRSQAILNEISKGPILEIGCGTAEVTKFLSDGTKENITAIDISSGFVKEAKKRCGEKVNIQCLSFEDFDPEQKFGAIVGNGILHHFENLDAMLAKIFRQLTPSGKAIFWEPNLMNPYCYLLFTVPVLRRMGRLEPQEMAFTKMDIISKMRKVGFNEVRVDYRDFLLPNTPDSLIKPLIAAGDIMEKMPILKLLSQSLFISASRVKN